MDVESAQNLSYLWQPPGKPISVVLSLDLVERLGAGVQEGVEQDPHRGIEVGGLLLGTVRRSGDRTLVTVEDFEPLECEHAVGPSFMLSAADRRLMERRIRAHRSSRPSVVGMYRSHTRREFALTVEDVDLMAEYFSQPSQVYLLIHALREKAMTAGFVIWEGRSVRSTRPSLEFPFDRAELAARGRDLRMAPAAPPAAKESAPAEMKSLWQRRGERPQVRQPARVVVPSETAPPPENAAATPPVARTAWKQPARLAGIAAAAVLIGLLPAFLHRTDSSPASAVTFIAPQDPAQDARVASAPPAPAPPAIAEENQPASPEPALPAPALQSADAPPPAPAKPRLEYRARAAMVGPRPPAAVEAPAPMASLPEAPAISVRGPAGATLAPAARRILSSSAPSVPEPPVAVHVQSAPARASVWSKLPLIRRLRKDAAFVPPEPVRQEQPEIPADLQDRITHEVQLDVKVSVDREGKVERAELVSNGARANRDLASAALSAARRWEFSPARSGGEASPAVVVLRFRFGPETR